MQKQRKSKARDNRPARERYWRKHTLRDRKVRRIMKNNAHLTKDEALKLWEEQRKGRRMKKAS
jgi:hypothetical protein